jgi:hypothetical protein
VATKWSIPGDYQHDAWVEPRYKGESSQQRRVVLHIQKTAYRADRNCALRESEFRPSVRAYWLCKSFKAHTVPDCEDPSSIDTHVTPQSVGQSAGYRQELIDLPP